MVDLGGHHLHVNCAGKGTPLVVIENGFDEFSFDWAVVRGKVARFARVCTYDRAGYGWSDPGPAPRTFAQINLELHDALKILGEQGPIVLVGHSFGGPIARNFAIRYPSETAGMVFVEAVSEDQRFEMWHRAVLMRDGAKGKTISVPHEQMRSEDRLPNSPYFNPARVQKIEPPFDHLSPELQLVHLWAQSQAALAAAEENERTWSPEYFACWHQHPDAARLRSIPLVVLSREEGGFHDLDISASQQEAERKTNQVRLASLSTNSDQRMISSGEDMQIERPEVVVQAIEDVLTAVRQHTRVMEIHRNY